MSRLTVRLLGGFEVRAGERAVDGFESQKVRALFAYLALHREKAQSRDLLAGLLWPERGEEAARRNLRQALYSIRVNLQGTVAGDPLLVGDHHSIRFHPELDVWIDVEAFEQALQAGLRERGADPHQLAVAARLYVGDFLAGFLVKGSTAFEEWLVSEKERLREGALTALRTLVEGYLLRGEYRVGIQYALRLVAIDSLSEEAHRFLMRLYALSGRRTRALAQYEEMRELLNSELGVEPLDETDELYRRILHDDLPARAEREERPLAPVIPLVGRDREFAALEKAWRRVIDEGVGRTTFVEGEAGSGKSRLVASVIDAVTSRHSALVFRGRAYADSAPVSFRPFVEALADVVTADPGVVEGALGGRQAGPRVERVSGLLLGSPETASVGRSRGATGEGGREAVFDDVARVLEHLATAPPGDPDPRPVILFLEDLQWADEPSWSLLAHLSRPALPAPIWIVVTRRVAEGEERTGPLPGAETLRVDSLGERAVAEMAEALVGVGGGALAGYLWRHGGGHPLTLAALVNHLWDEKVLRSISPGRWALSSPPAGEGLAAPPAGLAGVILRRFQGLPTSVRRLATLAAVAGPRFDAELLGRAGREHPDVVDIALELLLERWLIRQSMSSWAQPHRQRDLAMWVGGARRGEFEFAHHEFRHVLLGALGEERRRSLHASIAAALEAIYGEDLGRVAESLAYHLSAAGLPARAAPHLVAAAERAHALYADESARHLLELGRGALAAGGGGGPAELASRLEALEERLASGA